MRSIRLFAIVGLLFAVIAIVIIFKRLQSPNDKVQTAQHEDPSREKAQTEPERRETASRKEKPKEETSRTFASSTPPKTPSPNPDPAHGALLDVLEKYSGSRDWRLDVDNGRAFKMTGGHLKNVMTKGERNNAFLKDLQEALGFTEPADFTYETQSSASFQIVEQKQILNLSDGTKLPVFESKIRYVGDANGNAFLIYNELRPVRMNFRWELTLAPDDVLSIARDHLGNSDEFELQLTGATYAFAHSDPHQKVSEVIARKGHVARRLLIGHETRTVVWDRPLTVQ